MRYLVFGKDMFKDKGIHCREHRPGRWQVYFNHEGKQVHLQRDQNGHVLKSEEAATHLMMYVDKNGYDPRVFGKDKSFQFDVAARTWAELTKKDTERWKERARFVEQLFVPSFGKLDIKTIKTIHIDQFIAHLQGKGFQGSYIRHILGDLRAFFRFNKKSIPDPPEFRKIETQEKVINWLTADEQDEVFQFIPKKHLPIFTFLRWYGCRLNEACGLLWENVSVKKGYLSLATVVNRDRELIPFTKTKQLKIRPIIPEVEWIFENPNGSGFVFSFKDKPYNSFSLYRLWKRASVKANKKFNTPIVNVYCAMRHSFATQRLNMGFDLADVSAVLGHANVEMTKRYAKYSQEKLAQVLRGVHTTFIGLKKPNLLEYKDDNKKAHSEMKCALL
jgi:integrase/recombinase XerD